MTRIAIASLVAGLVLTPLAALAQTVADPVEKAPWWLKAGVITQTGYASKQVPANRAIFGAGFRAVDKTAEGAQRQATAQTQGLQSALAALGRDKVLVTTDVSMRPLYQEYRDANGQKIEDQRGDRITGYEVLLTLNLEVRDISQLGRAYSLVMAATPATTDDISFGLVPDHDLNAWLYTEATRDARRRATATAAATGGVLGSVRLIDMSGQTCNSDTMGRAPDEVVTRYRDDNDYGNSVQSSYSAKRKSDTVVDQVTIEMAAMQTPFVQSPPLYKAEASSCVVYELK